MEITTFKDVDDEEKLDFDDYDSELLQGLLSTVKEMMKMSMKTMMIVVM